jgi:fatty-acyl-CoA synthase
VFYEARTHWSELDAAGRTDRQGRQGVAGLTVMDPQSMSRVPTDGTTAGEIMFRGNQTMMGYLKDPEATNRASPAAGFTRATPAVLQADNCVRIKDRSKDIIISGG